MYSVNTGHLLDISGRIVVDDSSDSPQYNLVMNIGDRMVKQDVSLLSVGW